MSHKQRNSLLKKWEFWTLIVAIVAIVVTLIIGIPNWFPPSPRPDFSISVNPMEGSVQQGGVASTTVTVKGIDGYNYAVSLSASGQPSDMVVNFIPPIGGPTPAYTSNVMINVDFNVPIGDYPIVIKGTGADGKEHTCTYTLTVKLRKSPPTHTLSIGSSPITGVSFTLDGESHATTYSTTLDEGTHSVTMPESTVVDGTSYTFEHWEDDSTNPTRTVNLLSDMTITAHYEEYKGVNVSDVFFPSGWMGDWGDVTLDDASTDNPRSDPTCIKIVYSAVGSQGEGWAGIYWQYPDDNWGDKPEGQDLTGATKLTFWARGEQGGEKAEFKVGGITGKYPDSIQSPVSTGVIVLSDKWQQYTIDLTGRDLSHVIGGFCWVANKTKSPYGCTIYLDDIQYE